MIRYPDSPSTFDPLFTLSVRYGWRALREIAPLIIIFVGFISLLTHIPDVSGWVQWPLNIFAVAATVFLWVMAFYRVDGLWRDQPQAWLQVYQRTVGIILHIYLICLLLAVCCVLIFFGGKWFILLLGLSGAIGGLAMLLFIGIPMVVLLIFFYLVIPLQALYNRPIMTAVYDSALIARRYILVMLLLYAEIVLLMFIVSPHTLHGEWLMRHYLMELCGLAAFSVVLPLVINQTLLLLNDIQLRQQQRQASSLRGA